MSYANTSMYYQLLEAIGAISKKDSEKNAACGSNYQDDVAPQAEYDGEACRDDEDCEGNILEAISKVRSMGPLIPATGPPPPATVADSFPSALQSCTSGSLKSTEATNLA